LFWQKVPKNHFPNDSPCGFTALLEKAQAGLSVSDVHGCTNVAMTGRQRAACRASLKWLLGFGFLRRSTDYIPVVVPFHLIFSALLAESKG